MGELVTYISNNAAFVVNDGERISTAFTGFAVNQVMTKRMVKK